MCVLVIVWLPTSSSLKCHSGPAPFHQFEESIFHILIPQAVDDRVEKAVANVEKRAIFLPLFDKESEPGLMYVMRCMESQTW